MPYISEALNDGGEAHLNDLFVRHAGQEDTLLVVVRMESNHIRNLPVTKPVEALAGLSVPEFHLSVIATGQELVTVVRESEIFDGLYVSMESSQAVPVGVNVPQLDASARSFRTPV